MTKAVVTTDDVNALLNSCVLLRRAYMHYHELFEPSNPHSEIFTTLAPVFFGDINRILVMYIILEACKLADPARDSRGNVNLSVEFFLNHADFSNDPAGFDKLNNRATKIREFGKKLKPARDKIISHLDRPTAVSDIAGLGAADTAEWNEFWLDVDAFVQLLCTHHFAQVNHGLLSAAHSDVGRVVTTLRANGRGLANMTKKDQPLITSLGRISKYLPNTSLDPRSLPRTADACAQANSCCTESSDTGAMEDPLFRVSHAAGARRCPWPGRELA